MHTFATRSTSEDILVFFLLRTPFPFTFAFSLCPWLVDGPTFCCNKTTIRRWQFDQLVWKWCGAWHPTGSMYTQESKYHLMMRCSLGEKGLSGSCHTISSETWVFTSRKTHKKKAIQPISTLTSGGGIPSLGVSDYNINTFQLETSVVRDVGRVMTQIRFLGVLIGSVDSTPSPVLGHLHITSWGKPPHRAPCARQHVCVYPHIVWVICGTDKMWCCLHAEHWLTIYEQTNEQTVRTRDRKFVQHFPFF